MLCKKKLFLEISQELHQQLLEVVAQRYSVKKVFLEMSKNSQENTWARVSFLIIRLWHRCFPVIFAKFLRAPFLREHLWWLLLNFIKKSLWHRCFLVNLAKFLRTPFLQNTSGRLLLKLFINLKIFLYLLQLIYPRATCLIST